MNIWETRREYKIAAKENWREETVKEIIYAPYSTEGRNFLYFSTVINMGCISAGWREKL
jgi:hypothetical protein